MKFIFLIISLSILVGQSFDPNTGEVIPDTTNFELKFDPNTGVQILDSNQKLQSNYSEEISTSNKTNYTDFEVKKMAKQNAKDYFVGISWTALGGPTSLVGASILSNIGGEIFEEMGVIGGFVGGIYFIPEIISGLSINIPFYQEQFAYDNFSQNQFEIYKVEYEKEIKNLRKSSIYKGQGLTCLGCVAFTIFMIIGSF